MVLSVATRNRNTGRKEKGNGSRQDYQLIEPRPMPVMWSEDQKATALAVLASDIHGGHSPPPARGESVIQWYTTQHRYVRELRRVSVALGKIPIFVAGDVTNRWDEPPEWLNFAIRVFPKLFTIAGNHDLPHHDYNQMERSAYFTLAVAGVIENLGPYNGKPDVYSTPNGRLAVFAFPCRHRVTPPKPSGEDDTVTKLALIHSYIWTDASNRYKDAPGDAHISSWRTRIKGYDCAHFGDNHSGFLTEIDDTVISNTGTLIRRHANEVNYRPRIGVLYVGGRTEHFCLEVSNDREFSDKALTDEKKPYGFDVQELVDVLSAAGDKLVDFIRVLRDKALDGTCPREVREVLLQIIDRTGNNDA